jgi:type III pantothenate kinase
MELNLVLDIGNTRIKGGFFAEKTLTAFFNIASHPLSKEELMSYLEGKSIARALLSSVNRQVDEEIRELLEKKNIKVAFLDHTKLKMTLDVEQPEQLGPDRIAAAYGAVSRLPLNDSVVVGIGTAITADFVTKEGHYLGGMIYPGPLLCSKALSEHTDKLPLVAMERPDSPLCKTTKEHIGGGIYYGQLGALERLIDELRQSALSPSSVKVIATGGFTATDTPFVDDLKELVDFIDPHLILVGLNEILNELSN